MPRTLNDQLNHRSQRGVGLIEVLIAVLVLSFGMLGLAGLQVWSLKNNQSAFQRGIAVVQTYSIVDAMRADRATAAANGFNIGLGDSAPTGTTFAAQAIATWRTNLSDPNALGTGATGSIDCNGSYRCDIVIQWNDGRATEGSSTQKITTQVEL